MTIRLGLVGFGGVNRAFVDILRTQRDALVARGLDVRVTAISDRTLGAAHHPDGLDLGVLAGIERAKGGFSALPGGEAAAHNMRCADRGVVDVLVEASYTNPVDGEPSLSVCRHAVDQGVHVVTPNKGPIAFGYRDLIDRGRRTGAKVGAEATVMSGTPVLAWARTCFPGDTLTAAKGILNGTANFILGQMEAGEDFDAALGKAQELGYAEADPSADIEGHDVRLKVAILCNLLFDKDIHPSDIPTTGISGLTAHDVQSAAASGARWKLIGEASQTATGLTAKVEPQLLALSTPLASVSGATNALCLDSAHLGSVMQTGPGAGRIETAYGVFADLLTVVGEPALSAR